MSIKMIALAAATVAATASFAQADSYFAFGEVLEAGNSLDLGTIRAEGNGVVEIYDYRGGEQGMLLGSTMIHAGANQDVKVNVSTEPRADVLAVLKVGGQTVAIKDFDIRD